MLLAMLCMLPLLVAAQGEVIGTLVEFPQLYYSSRGIAVDAAGNLYVLTPEGSAILVSSHGVVKPIAESGSLTDQSGIAVDAVGNIYLADERFNIIRKITPGGVISTVAGTGNSGYSGDGGPATQAQLFKPGALAVDADGNLYVLDRGNDLIRKITTDGIIVTIAGNRNLSSLGLQDVTGDGGPAILASLGQPYAMAVDSAGNVYVTGGSRVRKINTNGIIDNFAGMDSYGFSGDGGPAKQAQLWSPSALAVDGAGNVYIADSTLNRIRRISPGGIIDTYAGNGGPGFSGDGGLAIDAQIASPTRLALDAGGNLYIGDSLNGRIRKVSAAPSALARPRLVSVSSRAYTATGAGVAIAGFIISGGSKTVLITARGPSLAKFGVSGLLANPRLRLVDASGSVLVSNDDWPYSNRAAPAIAATLGAPDDEKESAILATLQPGAYTAIMDGVDGTGNGLVAVDGVSNSADSGVLSSLSTRALVGTGDSVLIAGLIIVDGPRKVLLTARGPSLAAAGVSGVLADPIIELHDVGGALLGRNDNAADSANYVEIVATGRAPTAAQESAMLVTLQPGTYTLVVRGGSGSQGVALVAVDQVD